MRWTNKGYLVTVPVDDAGQAMFMLEGWERAFSTNENVFFKSSETLGKMHLTSSSQNSMTTMVTFIPLLLVELTSHV
jgi:hypothetical protein